MQRLDTWLNAAKAQLTGAKRQQATTWTAYTARGKIVVIQGDRVIKVIDPNKEKPPRDRSRG